MCGIIGYVGSRKASEVITDGLKRLEYRGYDSVGLAIRNLDGVDIRKDKGHIEDVSALLQFTTIEGNIGIGHTRWATHGSVCRENSHPHTDCSGKIVLVHNGVVENYLKLRKSLSEKGHIFISQTDSEVIVHLIEEHSKNGPLPQAFRKAIAEIDGSYAIAMISAKDHEERIYLARKNSPLILGIGKGEMLCASDIPAMLRYTKTFVALEDGDSAEISRNGYKVLDHLGHESARKQITVDWDPAMAQKGGYPHFMLKEINDQAHFINESLASDVGAVGDLIGSYGRIDIVACGTSYHAGLLFSILLQRKGKCAQAFIASDYPYVARPDRKTLVFAISQSGETADVLQALRFAKDSEKVALTNTVGSSICGLCDHVILMNSGPEIGVAATKTFTSELGVISKLIYGKDRLAPLSSLIGKTLLEENAIKTIASKLSGSEHAFFIARGVSVPIAYEGSLKFKEITYIHSEAYPGGELKHGTLSLISQGTPVIALAPDDESITKLIGNIKESKARGAFVISLSANPDVISESDMSIRLPDDLDPALAPFALIVILQLLAYHVSVLRGINPDRPRNLAKSVTVE